MPLVLRGTVEVRSSKEGRYRWMGIYLGNVPELEKYSGRRVCIVIYTPEECRIGD
ncbi:hypothetical protein [Vulcanisaeta moutnovskia]|uniref:hypothetical protein n=1 Tax=Vulcanisaeta moutnovskia TaxID=985052 RepID=UPI00130538C5|nr:hypothetical protein [Vulcanisaeta moutnovskia]